MKKSNDLRVMNQDRTIIGVLPREAWISGNGNHWTIVSTGYMNVWLGKYATEERAKEVLAEIFKAVEDGERTYIMPEE